MSKHQVEVRNSISGNLYEKFHVFAQSEEEAVKNAIEDFMGRNPGENKRHLQVSAQNITPDVTPIEVWDVTPIQVSDSTPEGEKEGQE